MDNDIALRQGMNNPEAMASVAPQLRGWRALGDNIIETIINKSENVKALKNKAKDKALTEKEKKQLTEEEKEYKSKRKLVQEKLIKFATRIPAFMYLTDFRENTLQDVITKLEPDLFLAVTGLTVADFHLLVSLKVFNTEHMNQAVFAFRRYEDASLRYTGIDSHVGLPAQLWALRIPWLLGIKRGLASLFWIHIPLGRTENRDSARSSVSLGAASESDEDNQHRRSRAFLCTGRI